MEMYLNTVGVPKASCRLQQTPPVAMMIIPTHVQTRHHKQVTIHNDVMWVCSYSDAPIPCSPLNKHMSIVSLFVTNDE